MRLDEFSSSTDLDGVLTPEEMIRFLAVGFDVYEISAAITGKLFVTWTCSAPSIGLAGTGPSIGLTGVGASIGLTGTGPSIGLTGTRPTITLTT